MKLSNQTTGLIVKEGVIYQSISGFYYVWSEGEAYATKPRGNFRHQKMKPLVGDRVKFELDVADAQSNGRLIEIQPRRNQMIRPAIVNVDHALVVMSLIQPDFSANLLDTFLVSVEATDIEAIIVLTKYDLLVEAEGQAEADKRVEAIKALYQKIGYPVAVLDGQPASYQALGGLIVSGIYVVMGQSGVGKSTLLNHLIPELSIETAAISDALNRGKHTTREVTLYRYHEGLLADTPGFSAMEFADIEKEELSHYFPEMTEASHECKFRSCLHINEPKCQVVALVESGEIAQSRYKHYLQMFEKIEQRKPIYNKRK